MIHEKKPKSLKYRATVPFFQRTLLVRRGLFTLQWPGFERHS
jgi:hypothetical protein